MSPASINRGQVAAKEGLDKGRLRYDQPPEGRLPAVLFWTDKPDAEDPGWRVWGRYYDMASAKRAIGPLRKRYTRWTFEAVDPNVSR